ncbi:hypothetical protein PanWU01x14_173180 [Parasponia andersonii]|uniref:Uncharacterized protein n=1 Tax=Parasponia andersonii TaxID=3476 RepID=A0A2P5C8N2_PARAD|nr:hypothetical protein PanWU01x14_173180 [Parasponia andersonii]
MRIHELIKWGGSKTVHVTWSKTCLLLSSLSADSANISAWEVLNRTQYLSEIVLWLLVLRLSLGLLTSDQVSGSPRGAWPMVRSVIVLEL